MLQLAVHALPYWVSGKHVSGSLDITSLFTKKTRAHATPAEPRVAECLWEEGTQGHVRPAGQGFEEQERERRPLCSRALPLALCKCDVNRDVSHIYTHKKSHPNLITTHMLIRISPPLRLALALGSRPLAGRSAGSRVWGWSMLRMLVCTLLP